jgi:hypothetical protein
MALEVAIENIHTISGFIRLKPKFGRPVLTVGTGRSFSVDYEKLATQLYPRTDLVGIYIRWALLFTRFRFELAMGSTKSTSSRTSRGWS